MTLSARLPDSELNAHVGALAGCPLSGIHAQNKGGFAPKGIMALLNPGHAHQDDNVASLDQSPQLGMT